MLPYFHSMEAFFNLSLPINWQSQSGLQLIFFFSLLSQDKAMEEVNTLNSSLVCRTDPNIGPMRPLCIDMDYNIFSSTRVLPGSNALCHTSTAKRR